MQFILKFKVNTTFEQSSILQTEFQTLVTKTLSYYQLKSCLPHQALCFQETDFYMDGIQKFILRGISTPPSYYCKKNYMLQDNDKYSMEKR